MKSLTLLLLLCSTAFAQQIELSATSRMSVIGLTEAVTVGDRTLVGMDSNPMLVPVAIVKLRAPVPGVQVFAVQNFAITDLQQIPGSQTDYMLVGSGEYLVIAAANQTRASIRVTVGQGPRPPPDPPIPPPDPPDPPSPQPVTSFHVIFVKESGTTLSAAQTAIPGAKVIRDYLFAKTTSENLVTGWREYDPDVNVTNEQPTMKALWEAVKPKITTVPCLVLERNGKADILPYPANVADALALLKKAGG